MELECPEIWSNIGLCFSKKRKLIAVKWRIVKSPILNKKKKKQMVFQAISCLKKAIWMSPLNFNCLYNLGLIYIIAQQYASAYQTLACAINLRPDSAESYMLLGSTWKNVFKTLKRSRFNQKISFFSFVVVLKNLNDLDNAYLAMEKSAMLPEAIKNPLIYLNFAIFCAEIERTEQAWSSLDNFNEIANQTRVKNEVIFASFLKFSSF